MLPSHSTGFNPSPEIVPTTETFPACVPISTPAGQSTTSPPQPAAIDLRVLHVVNGEHFSGAERVQSHLGRCLPKFGVAADFAFVKPGRFFKMLRSENGDWGRGFDTPMKNRVDLRAALRVRDLVRLHRYDLLHAHTPRTAMIAAAATEMTGTPWIYHVHSPASRDSDRRITNQINAWIEQFSVRHCSHQITVSESLRRDCLLRGTPSDRISVVHNGVPAIRPQRNGTPLPGGRWTIGMVALMRPRKGLEIVLEALSILNKAGHDVTLRCIGPFETSEYQSEIETLIDRLGIRSQVEQQGFVHDVPNALAKLDAMVLPSLYGEGLPMVVLEAMAAALPVIATEVEGTPEAITHGVEGLLAKPRDPVSLAEASESLLSGQFDWSQMAEAAADRHRRCFSDLAMAERTAEIYRMLLHK